MLYSPCATSLRPNISHCSLRFAYIARSCISRWYSTPNPPINLDSSLRTLLKDVDASVKEVKSSTRFPNHYKELEAFTVNESGLSVETLSLEEDEPEPENQRKSPAAHFGSQRIGAVVLPLELQSSINLLISESDKPQLRNDAKRLFFGQDDGNEGDSEEGWSALYNVKYRSRQQAVRHAERDGTAFATVALPAHYAAISAVFDHMKRRLDPSFKVTSVVEWGSGTGSGLWASLYSFQKLDASTIDETTDHTKAHNSTVNSYIAIDRRDGLVSIGKRLLHNIDLGELNLVWQKSFKDNDKLPREAGDGTLAISAFLLTSLSNTEARKSLVKEMWESGAHTLVLIDHNTTAGFGAIAEAREYLLHMGRKEVSDPETEGWPIRGSHVLAPCPHDGACPLYNAGPKQAVCGFEQRLQRPSFVRRTKHSGVGHEDIGYSYVVIRRGSRPSSTLTNLGRIGEVGKRALDKEKFAQKPVRELMLHSEYERLNIIDGDDNSMAAERGHDPDQITQEVSLSQAELQEALRLEAHRWPRLVFPPLKRSGHIILDSCTAEGKIMRITIPRSQGKQAYYDARKSNWGDIFPHPPKNKPQERFERSQSSPSKEQKKSKSLVEQIATNIKKSRRQARRERRHLDV